MTVNDHKCPEHDEEEAPFVHQPAGEGFCQKCGACLYKHGKQVPDDMFCFIACKKCGQVNLWD